MCNTVHKEKAVPYYIHEFEQNDDDETPVNQSTHLFEYYSHSGWLQKETTS